MLKRAALCAVMSLALAGVAGAQQGGGPPARASSPSSALAAGVAALRASNYSDAEKALTSVAGADRPAALLALAHARFERGLLAEAEHAAAQAGGDPNLRLVATCLQGQILASRGKVDDAIKLLDPHKDGPGVGGRCARLELGELLIRVGRRADAEPLLQQFADEYSRDAISATDAEGLAMVGRAMHLLRQPKDANRAYNESERAERGRIETLLWRADLYIDKYDPGHAEEVLREALNIGPHRADALVKLARVKLEEALDFATAEKLAGDALAINPSDTGAIAVRADIALRDGNLDRARRLIDHGLLLNASDLELLSMRAAERYLADDKGGFESAKAAVFARDKEFSQTYGIIGEFAEWEHRYADVTAMMQEAVARDPDDAKAWAQLGLMQTRAGDEAAGVQSLENAWHRDRFNVRVYNTLQLFYKKWIPTLYDTVKDGLFNVRYPKDERLVLERYVPRLLGEAWGTMKIHYAFAPVTPVAVEMYRDRQHFSVRTSGLPNVGIQGVCFGRVVAAMSPNSEPFNWGNVLWHELAHVFAIQISNSHVPRWFTEGLSEYETMVRRPEWRRELDPEFYLALKKGRLPGALDMNVAFTHAEGDLDVTVAYYAASQMLAFTGERYGFRAISQALALWGQGRATATVFTSAFGVTPAQFDTAFRAWALARLVRFDGQYMFDAPTLSLDEAETRAQAAPRDPSALVAHAVALLRAHKHEDASRKIEEALKVDPRHKDAHFLAFKIAAQDHDLPAAEEHLQALRAAGGDGYVLELGLAEVARSRHDKGAERAALEQAHRYDPIQAEPLRALYEIANEEKRDDDALAALREVARLDQHDRRAWGLLLERLTSAHRWNEARRVGEAALYVDVESAAVHLAYARALSATADHEGAVFELESALLCDSKPEEKAAVSALLARERAFAARGSQPQR